MKRKMKMVIKARTVAASFPRSPVYQVSVHNAVMSNAIGSNNAAALFHCCITARRRTGLFEPIPRSVSSNACSQSQLTRDRTSHSSEYSPQGLVLPEWAARTVHFAQGEEHSMVPWSPQKPLLNAHCIFFHELFKHDRSLLI